MHNRDKVSNGLCETIGIIHAYIPKQYWGYGEQACRDALALLKEQEEKTGKWIPIESPTGVKAFGVNEMTVMDVRCSVCGSEEDVSFTGYKYCPRCGTKMKGR